MNQNDLEIYLKMCRKNRIEYFQSPETLKKIDEMEVKALDLFHNPPTHSGLAEKGTNDPTRTKYRY